MMQDDAIPGYIMPGKSAEESIDESPPHSPKWRSPLLPQLFSPEALLLLFTHYLTASLPSTMFFPLIQSSSFPPILLCPLSCHSWTHTLQSLWLCVQGDFCLVSCIFSLRDFAVSPYILLLCAVIASAGSSYPGLLDWWCWCHVVHTSGPL